MYLLLRLGIVQLYKFVVLCYHLAQKFISLIYVHDCVKIIKWNNMLF